MLFRAEEISKYIKNELIDILQKQYVLLYKSQSILPQIGFALFFQFGYRNLMWLWKVSGELKKATIKLIRLLVFLDVYRLDLPEQEETSHPTYIDKHCRRRSCNGAIIHCSK